VMAVWENFSTDHMRRAFRIIAQLLASGLGAGYCPLAPGTVGSLAAAAAAWLFIPAAGRAMPIILLAVMISGTFLASRAEEWWGQDPPRVVIDEMAGQWLGLWLLPKSIFVFLAAFLLFRFFDILKPWGIDAAQELPRGWGVMADDLLAGLYTNILMQAAVLVFYRDHSLLTKMAGWG